MDSSNYIPGKIFIFYDKKETTDTNSSDYFLGWEGIPR